MEERVKVGDRLYSLDVLKSIAAVFVVLIHDQSVLWLNPVIRTAVPLFFIISGYYYPQMVEKGRFWGHIRKLLKMAIIASCIYALWTLQIEFRHGRLVTWLFSTFSLRNISIHLLSSDDLFGVHLWFFWASLYDLIFLYVIDRLHRCKAMKPLIVVLFLTFCIVNFTPHYRITRNWLFMGLPCMCIGRWIREGDTTILKIFREGRHCSWLASLFFALCWVEFVVIYMMHDTFDRDMYVFSIPLVVSVFYLALAHPHVGGGSFMATVGRKYSAYIYISHVLINYILSYLFDHFIGPDNCAIVLARIVLTVLISLALSMIWVKLKSLRHDCPPHKV